MQTMEPDLPRQGWTMSDEAAPADAPAYAVRFRAGRTAGNPAPNSYALHGKGSIQFRRDELLIDASRHRLFRSGVPERHRIALADIYNARLSGKNLRFDVRAGDAAALRMGFIVADERSGLAILNALPRRHTEAF